jgi:hypothetical protein
MESRRDSKGKAGTTWQGRLGRGIGIAGAITVVTLFVGSAAAAPSIIASPATTYRAPYSGVEDSNEFGLLSGSGGPICGVSESFPVSPIFNMTSGHANQSVKAAAHSCGPGTSFASPEEDAGFVSMAYTTTSGLHHLKANWALDFAVRLAATPGGASQSATASFSVTTQFYLLDETNGSMFNSNNSPYVIYQITSGTYSHDYPSIHLSIYLNATLVKGHTYQFGVFLYVGASASVSPGTSKAFASINLGSGGRNAFLASITGI